MSRSFPIRERRTDMHPSTHRSWRKPLSARSFIAVALGCAVVGGSLFVSASAPPRSRVVVLSCAGDVATVQDKVVVVAYENGIGNVRIAPNEGWPDSVTIHFAPPFHRGLEAFAASPQTTDRWPRPLARPHEALPHRLLHASSSEGVRYEVDTRTLSDDATLGVGWIDAWRR